MVRKRDLSFGLIKHDQRGSEFLKFFTESSYASLFGHASFVLLASSYLFSDMVGLRVLAIGSGLSMMVFNFWHPYGQVLWLPLRWNAVFIGINVWKVWTSFFEKREANRLSPQAIKVFHEVFAPSGMAKVDFLKLIRLAEWEECPSGTALCKRGTMNNKVRLMVNGRAQVTVENQVVYEVQDQQFISEMGIATGLRIADSLKSVATVTTTEDSKCLAWTRGKLIDLMEENPELGRTMQMTISNDLVRKALNRNMASGQHKPSESNQKRLVDTYEVLLANVLASGKISTHERLILRRYRKINYVDDEQHLRALQENGWTLPDYEAGQRQRTNKPPRHTVQINPENKKKSSSGDDSVSDDGTQEGDVLFTLRISGN